MKSFRKVSFTLEFWNGNDIYAEKAFISTSVDGEFLFINKSSIFETYKLDKKDLIEKISKKFQVEINDKYVHYTLTTKKENFIIPTKVYVYLDISQVRKMKIKYLIY